MSYRPFLLMLGTLLCVAPVVRAQDVPTAGRRVADIATIAVAEYGDGVRNGTVVRPEEFEEARLFLEEARRTAAGLPTSVRAPVLARLDALAELQSRLRDVTELETELRQLRAELETGLGISLDPMPENAPSMVIGAQVYEANCRQCHGAAGAGDATSATFMDPPPADLTDADVLRSVPPVDFFRKVNVGVAGTAMPGFESVLSLDERWAVALYTASLRHQADRATGRALLDSVCADCGLVLGDLASTAQLGDDSLAAVVASLTDSLGPEALAAAVAFARVAAAEEYWGGDRVLAIQRTIHHTRGAVEDAVLLARRGQQPGAVRAALDAYLVFEGVESSIRAQDAGAVRKVEAAFGALRAVLATDPTEADLTSAHSDVLAALDAVSAGVVRKMAPSAFFVQSFIILVREGLEAILIVGALVAFLMRSGAQDRRRDIGLGVLWALGASVATALAFGTIVRAAPAHQELLEGFTMLLASAVLFFVSYWLVSKIETRKWTAFVRAQMASALTSGRSWALAGVAFLAVYREGFETVLFYAALLATADGQIPAIVATTGGFVAGALVLGVVYVAMQRFGLRIPLRPFFAVTSALLYLMAFSFAGQGVAELQEVGWVGLTPMRWIPSIPALGIFPTFQTVLGQSLLAMALVGALAWVFWGEPRSARVRASA